MQDSKLIELLRTLQPRELTRFSEYIRSPYFNKHLPLQAFCDYMIKFAPEFDSPKLSRERIWAHLHPKTAYDESALHSLSSKLLRLLYDFMVDEHWQEQPRERDLRLLQQLRLRKLEEKHLQPVIKRLSAEREPKQKEQSRLYLEDYEFHKELDLQFLSRGGRTYDEHLQQRNNALDRFYLTEKLRTACDMLNRNVVIQAHYDPTLLRWLLDYLAQPENRAICELPPIAIYFCILQTLREPEHEPHYHQLKALLRQHHAGFHQDEAMDMYGYALNYCIQKINKGQIRFYEEVLGLYELLVEERILFLNGYLPAWEYKNIVTAALRLGRYAWAQQFVETYKPHLPPDIRENAYLYNLSSIYYATRQYKQALQTLHNVEFTDATYYLGAKIIQLKSYYELDEADAFQSLIEAFQVYLRRSKEVSEYRKQSNATFLRFARKLYALKEDHQRLVSEKFRERYQQFVRELQQTAQVANRDWLEDCLRVWASPEEAV